MLFTNNFRQQSISITVNNQTINEVPEIKFLGVILDNRLTWNAHIKHISSKISKSISLLKMLKFTFPTNVLKCLYHSLVYPYLNYCNIIWGGAASTNLIPLTLLQKKCIRIICRVGYLAHTDALFKSLRLLKLEDIYNLSCIKFVFQCYNNTNYSIFKNRLRLNSSFHGYETRSRNLLRKPSVRLHQFTNSFLYNGIDIWNSLPNEIKTSKTLVSLKSKYKKEQLSKYNDSQIN